MNKKGSRRTENFRRELAANLESIEKCRRYSAEIRENSEKLYSAYLRNEYGRKEYERAVDEYLAGRTVEEWSEYYSEKIEAYSRRKSELENRIDSIENGAISARAVLAVLMILAIGIGAFFIKPATTGFATLNETPENLTEPALNLSVPEGAVENLTENITENITAVLENITEGIIENATENISTAENLSINISELNVSVPETNATANITAPEENATGIIPEAPLENITGPEENISANITINLAPELILPIEDFSIIVGEKRTIDLSAHFADAENDSIIYLASGADGLSIAITGENAEITAEKAGTYTIRFIASDLISSTYSNEISVIAEERTENAPECIVPKQTITRTSEITINLSIYCTDVNGDVLHYSVLSAENLTIAQNEENITITANSGFEGIAEIRIEATNSWNSTEHTIEVEVLAKGFKLTTEEFTQSDSEIGKPVYWTKSVKVENIEKRVQEIEIPLPEDAENITVYRKSGTTEIEASDIIVKEKGKEKTLSDYNNEKAAERIRINRIKEQQKINGITGFAVYDSRNGIGLLERFIDWIISIFRSFGRITGFAVSDENITEPENLTESPLNLSVPESAAENLTENITENITAALENITESVIENATENISTTENLNINISELNVSVPEINATANASENATEEAAPLESITPVPEIAEEEPVKEITAEIAENITAEEETKEAIENATETPLSEENITAENATQATEEALTESFARNITILTTSAENEEYLVEFATTAPESIEGEEITTGSVITKNVTITSNSAVHYINTTAYSDITEAKPEQIRIYLIKNGSREDVTENERYAVRFLDLNNNSMMDRIVWIVPMLSNESFEIEIELNVITVQSYPMVGGNWTTEFNTTGTANLTISAYNETTYREEPIDLNETADDLRFLEITCGNESRKDSALVITSAACVNGTIENSSVPCFGTETVYANYTILSDSNLSIPVSSIFIENYNCTESSYYTVYVMTPGKHDQEFRFGGKTAHSYNVAGLPAITMLKPVNNTIVHTGVVLNFSITSANATWYSNNGSANATFYSPYEINTSGWSEGIRTVTVFANNSNADVRTNIYTFTFNNSAYGHFEPYYVWPYEDFGNTTVPYLKFFTFKAGVRCIGGPCGNINATLDPEEINRMIESAIKSQIENYVNGRVKTGKSGKIRVTVEGIVILESENEGVSYQVSTRMDEE
ncbi:MAG: hypothetical protein NTV63_04485 [Candidatus Woesearchaeota archaeon]|nr:hypothetical protein [Candidatus Woesearchaeota archaeon]